MLNSLEIENFILIKKVSINFNSGFNAFTGETGAGKSIIIEGLKLVLGSKNYNNLQIEKNEISKIFKDYDVKVKIEETEDINDAFEKEFI